jgi:hypothetical protein
MLIENDFKRISVLHKLQESLKQTGVASRMIQKGEEGSPFLILNCTFERPSGDLLPAQFYFPEMECAENVCYFSALITIKKEIPEEEKETISKMVEEANDSLLCGAYSIVPEMGLAYRLTVPIFEELSENDLFATIDIAAAHALAFSNAFITVFNKKE